VKKQLTTKGNHTEIEVVRARDYIPQKARTVRSSSSDEEDSKRNDKLVNIVHTDGKYYIFEPRNVEASPSNVIDNNLWLAARFMPKVRMPC